MKMRDWELLASLYQIDVRNWFISFYKERGLDEQRLHEVFSVPFSSGDLDEMILKYVELHPGKDSFAFARAFWDCTQDAIEEYYRVRSHPLFELHWSLSQGIDWLKSWGNCVHFRSQDLNEGRTKKEAWFHRRYRLTLYKERYEECRNGRALVALRLEIIIPSRLGVGIYLDVGGEDQFRWGVKAGWLGAFWLSVEELLPSHWLPNPERETGISLFEDFLSFHFWWDDFGWNNKWRGISEGIFVLDLLFGRTKYERSPAIHKKVEIYLPEATYEGTAEAYIATWTRPRAFWWKQEVHRVELEFPQGIPIPGKGENSYDLDDGAVYNSTMPAKSIEEALQRFIEDILKTRQQRGGAEWLPERRGAT